MPPCSRRGFKPPSQNQIVTIPPHRALVVVHAGRIVAERYAPGFNADMPLIGWSMTKIAIDALAGVLVQDRRLRLATRPYCLNGGMTDIAPRDYARSTFQDDQRP